MTRSTSSQRRWTHLGQRLGITSTPAARAQIAGEAAAIDWTSTPPVPRWLAEPPLAALAAALFGHGLNRLRSAGVVQLRDGRQLIGLADMAGTRWFLLTQPTPGSEGLLSEVIVVFTERPAVRGRAA